MNTHSQQNNNRQYQSQVTLLRHYVDMLDGNRELMRPDSIRMISNQMTAIMEEISWNIPDLVPSTPSPPREPLRVPDAPERNPNNVTLRSDLIDEPMTLAELMDNDEEDDNSSVYNSEQDYQDYIGYKRKPKLNAKCHSKKDAREKSVECTVCYDTFNLHNVVTLGCNHEFCVECVQSHFHASIENQPYQRHYACPICRESVKKVSLNYSKFNAKNKEEIMQGQIATELKVYCN